VKFILHNRDDISHVALEGRLDADGVAEMEPRFADTVINRGLPTIVDMSGISFMSSLGIGMLFDNSKKLKKSGRKLVLLNPQGMVETVLRTSKMDKLMPLVYDLQEAVRLVGGDATIGATAGTGEATAGGRPDSAVTAGDNILKLTIKNEMSELTALYAKANELLVRHRVPYRSGYAMNLAIEELVVNVIRYAWVDDDEHNIDIGLGIVGEQIILEIRDSGRPFDPREAPPHDPDAEDLQVGGLGLILVLDIVDTLSYRRENDKNHVRVCVQIRSDESGELWTAPIAEASTSEASAVSQ
jgi:serine/threonine-protein kinase RsbW/sigma-B regulation protein RsbU (phosphoserine phosphatase)